MASTRIHVLYSVIAITGVALFFPAVLFADTTVINNTTSARTNTGGNSVNNGVVTEGSHESTVYVETVVNGETVEYINETYDSGSIEVESSVTVSGESVSATSSVSTDLKTDEDSLAEVEPSMDTEKEEMVLSESEVDLGTTSATSTESVEISETFIKKMAKKITSVFSYVFSLFRP